MWRLLFLILILEQVFALHTENSPNATTATPDYNDDDDDWEENDSSEVDDDGRIYKNPRNSPSTLCPRDEEQATLLGQKCLRKCSSDEDCKSKKKKCLCDGACGMSCIKPDRECPEPTEIQFGGFTTSGKLFGSKVTYSCQHGYHVVGLQTRTCQADGQWAGSTPACKQNIYCLSPPTIDHARHNALSEQTTFDLDSTLQYYCHPGYVTNGFPRAKCLAIDGQASWYGPDISCEPRSCGSPTDIGHGWHAGECYTYGCRINYHCAEGYELVGKNERFCQADGIWTPKDVPTCVLVTAVQCPPPENPRHGKAVYTSCSYNSVVSYECKYGFTLVGESTRRCGADRKWSGNQPTCKEINCGHPGRLWNGWLENIEGGTGLGASIIFRCHEGMLLEGNTSTVCQIDGKWRYSLPKCLAPCVVPHVSQGNVFLISKNDTAPTSTVVQHGEILTVNCDPQYEFLSSSLSVMCNNGTWTNIPKCEPARCKHLPKPPKHGMVIAPKMEHGMRARFRCKDGFRLKGSALSECHYGNWRGELPKCEELFCPYPGNVENGKILLVGNMGLYDYRPYVRKISNNKQIMYDCDKGYYLAEGPPGATCIGGEWSPRNLPKCLLGQHPRLRWNRRRRSTKEKWKIDKLAFKNQNETHIYKSQLFKKFKRALKGGGSGRAFGSGHKSSGSNISLRRKNKNNVYEEEEEDDSDREERISKFSNNECEPLLNKTFFNYEIVRNGRDKNATFSTGTIVKFKCAKGFHSNVNETVKCVKGIWKPAKPVCSILSCLVPTISNGVYKFSKSHTFNTSIVEKGKILKNTTKISHGQVVRVICYRGYNLQGAHNLTCWHGKWTVSNFPECTPGPCLLPNVTKGQYMQGYRSGLTIASGSSITFQCDNEKNKTMFHSVKCILGKLYPKILQCKSENKTKINRPHYIGGTDILKDGDIVVFKYEPPYCGPPKKVEGSLIYKNGKLIDDNDNYYPYGSEVTFQCIESIIGEKTTWKIICEEGNWNGKSLNCESEEYNSMEKMYDNETCTFRYHPKNNVITFLDGKQIKDELLELPSGSTIINRCIDIGKYAMTGTVKRKCINGKWTGVKPVCFGLSQENDYSMEKPPTILFRHQGPIAQSNDGKLIVYPGSTVHMECLWIRRFGNPKWATNHKFRNYTEGWSTGPGRDSGLEYRLTIDNATKNDSGVYTCTTPPKYTHSIEVEVKAVHCPVFRKEKGVVINTKQTILNTRLTFSCANGTKPLGPSESICQPSGNWSHPSPICDIVNCRTPKTPKNGYIQNNGPFKAGDSVQFGCNPDYIMDGQPVLQCQRNLQWSGKVPACIQACPYPGTTISGSMSAVKFYYKIGEFVVFSCDKGFLLNGTSILKCLKSGKWSNPIPTCVLNNNY